MGEKKSVTPKKRAASAPKKRAAPAAPAAPAATTGDRMKTGLAKLDEFIAENKFTSIDQVNAILGIGNSTIYSWKKYKRIPAYVLRTMEYFSKLPKKTRKELIDAVS